MNCRPPNNWHIELRKQPLRQQAAHVSPRARVILRKRLS